MVMPLRAQGLAEHAQMQATQLRTQQPCLRSDRGPLHGVRTPDALAVMHNTMANGATYISLGFGHLTWPSAVSLPRTWASRDLARGDPLSCRALPDRTGTGGRVAHLGHVVR